MTYLEAVDLIREIESKYDLMKVTYKDVSVWPLLRVNIVDAITGNNDTMKSIGSSAIKQVLSTLFYYNPLAISRNAQYGYLPVLNEEKRCTERDSYEYLVV